MVEATARFKKIVQVGTMNRSRPAMQQAIKFMKDGGIGKVYMARGLCFKPRPSIGKYPDGPMAADAKFKLNVEATTNEPTYDAQYLSKVNYDLWIGPAPKRPFNPNRFHYNWHWHWDYGNGDTGNQGPHQFDIARWGLGKQEHPVKVCSMGGYFGSEASQETPDMQTALFDTPTARSSNSARAESPRTTKAASGSATSSTERKAGSGRRNQGACGSPTWDRWAPRTRRDPDPPPRPRKRKASRRLNSRTIRTSSTRSAPTIRRCWRATSWRGTSRPRCRTSRTSRIVSGTA